MAVCDAAKFRLTQLGRGHNSSIDDRAANLERAQIALGKRATGKIRRRERKLIRTQSAQIIREQPNFLELGWTRANCFADFGEFEEFGLGSTRVSRVWFRRLAETIFSKSPRPAKAFGVASTRDGCATQTREFELVLFRQRPCLHAAVAQVARELRGKPVERENAFR